MSAEQTPETTLHLAGEAVELGDGKRIHIMRIGPIYDPSSGDHVGDITAELAREAAAGANAFIEAGNTIPLSLDHGIERALADQTLPAERRRSFGTVTDFAFDESTGEVWGVAHLNRAGLDYVADHQGAEDGEGNSLRISPCLHMSPLTHTTTGEELARAWIEVVSLTNTPRQDRMSPVMLARGEREGTALLARSEEGALGADGAVALRSRVELAMLEALAAIGVHRPSDADELRRTYACLLDFTGDRALVKIEGFSYDQPSRVFMLPFHLVDGEVEVTGAPVEGVMRETFTPLAVSLGRELDGVDDSTPLPQSEAGATIPSNPDAEADNAPEDDMSDTDNMLLARGSEPAGLLLARVGLSADADEGTLVTALLARLDEADQIKATDEKRLQLAREQAADALLAEHEVEGAERAMLRSLLLGNDESKALAEATLLERNRPDYAAEVEQAVQAAKERGAVSADYAVAEDTIALARNGGPALKALLGAIEALPAGQVVRVGEPKGSTNAGTEDDLAAARNDQSAAIAELSRLASERATEKGIAFGDALRTIKSENETLARRAYGEGVNL